jgi:hypothetical protein
MADSATTAKDLNEDRNISIYDRSRRGTRHAAFCHKALKQRTIVRVGKSCKWRLLVSRKVSTAAEQWSSLATTLIAVRRAGK